MSHYQQFYINGNWVAPKGTQTLDVINPATEEAVATIALGNKEDVDLAVAAAKAAFESYSQTTREERIALLERVIEVFKKRMGDVATAISQEMGAPAKLAKVAQAPSGLGHFVTALAALKEFEFEETIGTTLVTKEPIGVCGLITPWNWPMNQLTCKVAPALATGCTMVLKPSEVAPLSALVLAEILDEGAQTIKRVALELGGKSANILLDDVNFEKMVAHGVMSCMNNSGQSCNAPTRMLVPNSRMDEVAAIAQAVVAKVKAGDPNAEDTVIGPVVSKAQWTKIQDLITAGIEEGAKVIAGGPGRPEGLDKGYYVKPTIFSHVNNEMTIAREEIFGPVLSMLPFDDEEEAIRIANDTAYGLTSYVQSGNQARAQKVARQLRAGMVLMNGASRPAGSPFGGYKQSGNGREGGVWGMLEFLEVKAISGWDPAA